MSILPASGYISNLARTEGEVQGALEDMRSVIGELPGGGNTASTLTIAGGSITPTGGCHLVDTEAAAATDDLTNIVQTNHPDSRFLYLRSTDDARDVVVKHAAGGAGQIVLAGGADYTLKTTRQWLILRRNAASWEEVDRFYGDQASDNRAFLGLGSAAILNTGTGGGNIPTVTQAATLFAALVGLNTQVFSVANASTGDHAVNRTTGDVRYAALAGLNSQVFSVANASAAAHALPKGQADTLYEPVGGGSSGVPTGVIALWHGITANIPVGWALCDGNNGTPDMRGMLNVGATADGSNAFRATGFGAYQVNTVQGLTAHGHSFSGSYSTSPAAQSGTAASGAVVPVCGGHGHTVGVSGNTGSASNLPRAIALAYIMKL